MSHLTILLMCLLISTAPIIPGMAAESFIPGVHLGTTAPSSLSRHGALDQGTDACPGMMIPAVPFFAEGTTCGYMDNFAGSCLPPPAPDVVYQFVPMQTAEYTISLCGSYFDTGLHLRTDGPCPGMVEVACNNNYCGAQSQITNVPLYAGLTYYIIVDGILGQCGPYVFDLTMSEGCHVWPQPGDMVECPEVPDTSHSRVDCDGGCNNDNAGGENTFGFIAAGSSVYGAGFTYQCAGGQNCRDTDWYVFTLVETDCVTVTAIAEFPMLVAIVDTNECVNPQVIAYAQQPTPCTITDVAVVNLPPGSYVVFVAPLTFTGVPYPAHYRLSLQTSPHAYGGTITVEPDELVLPPTGIGGWAEGLMVVANSHPTEPLLVSEVKHGEGVWTVFPSTFVLAPGEHRIVTIQLRPSFDHEFETIVEFLSSDPLYPRDSVQVSGWGCEPVVMPPAPILHSAGSPTKVYYELPWDANGKLTLYRVEYSTDNFASAPIPAGFFAPGRDPFDGDIVLPPDPENWATAYDWSILGIGAIVNLEPATTYQVRLRARDCLGNEVVGPYASITTEGEIVIGSQPELTIRVINADTLELNWNPEITDTLGNPLPNLGYLVYIGSVPDVIDSLADWSTTGSVRLPTGTWQKGFFYTMPVIEGVTDFARPFISWPPEGAVVSGVNSVAIQDYAHYSQWDSFTVEVDSAGIWTLAGSNLDNLYNLKGDRRMITVDFDQYPAGVIQLRCRVVYGSQFWEGHRLLINRGPLRANDYHATYIPTSATTGRFVLDTTRFEGNMADVRTIYWPFTNGIERYGGHVQFDWHAGQDSVIVNKPNVVPSMKVLEEFPKWFVSTDSTIAVVPDPVQPKRKPNQVGICCTGVTITTGQPWYTCTRDVAIVGLPFRVKFQWKATDQAAPTSHGQDAKGDRTYTYGKCMDGPPPSFEPNPSTPNSPNPIRRHKRCGGRDYKYNDAEWGNDDYRVDRHDDNLIWNEKKTELQWDDCPNDRLNKLPGKAMRIQGQNKFKVWARTKCTPPPVVSCCKTFEINWDFVCCENQSMIVNLAPALSNLQDCPDE